MSASTPSKIGWTYESYAAIPSDGCRHEIIGGEHFVNPAPNLYHQQISRRLQFQLYESIELQGLGVVINAPVDVQLSDQDIVQPDLVVIRNSNSYIMTPTKVKGIPDLLVEILSPSNSAYDLETKRQMYERFQVPEYLIVFPDEHHVLQLKLAGGVFRELYFSLEIEFDVPPMTCVDLRKVW